MMLRLLLPTNYYVGCRVLSNMASAGPQMNSNNEEYLVLNYFDLKSPGRVILKPGVLFMPEIIICSMIGFLSGLTYIPSTQEKGGNVRYHVDPSLQMCSFSGDEYFLWDIVPEVEVGRKAILMVELPRPISDCTSMPRWSLTQQAEVEHATEKC